MTRNTGLEPRAVPLCDYNVRVSRCGLASWAPTPGLEWLSFGSLAEILDFGFYRRVAYRKWIPAFAGMTKAASGEG